MTRQIICLVLMVAGLTVATANAAQAKCGYVTTVEFVQGAAQTNQIYVCDGSTDVDVSDEPLGPPTDSGLDSICVAQAMSLGQDPYGYCGIPVDTAIDITPGLVATALARVKPPPAQLEVQPANGRTLVNFDTNFFTTLAPFDTSLPMLGRTVDLHLVPSAFAWRFGDGGASTTAEPGAPYPALDVTHRYLTKGHVAPSVDTTWSATYRVDGGPWAPVPGTVTVAGPAVDLQVLTATPTLVGYRAQ